MKTLITLLFSCLAILAFSQETTETIHHSNYGWHTNDNKSWVFATAIDTLNADTAPDTIIANGDTILTDFPDTLILNAPHNFANPFSGIITINMDTIQAYTDLTGTLEVRTAQCSACPYFTIKTITLPDVDTYSRDTFNLQDIKMQLRIIAATGLGSLKSWITLKPSYPGSW